MQVQRTTDLFPKTVKESFSLLRRIIKGELVDKVEAKASKGCYAMLENLWVVGLVMFLLFLGQLALPHRQAEVRRTLEEGDRSRILPNLLCDLNAS